MRSTVSQSSGSSSLDQNSANSAIDDSSPSTPDHSCPSSISGLVKLNLNSAIVSVSASVSASPSVSASIQPAALSSLPVSKLPAPLSTQLPTQLPSQLPSQLTPSSRIPFPTNHNRLINSCRSPVKLSSLPASDQVAMLKDQLSKIQSELRLARGQLASQDEQAARATQSPPSKGPPFGSTLPTVGSLAQARTSTASLAPSTSTSSPRRRLSKHRTLRKSSSATSSSTSDGLSIRFISAAGPSTPASMDGLPTTDSGYVKDPNGVWVPIQGFSPGARHPLASSASAPQRARSSEEARGLSRIPVSAVTLGRVLAGDTHPPDPHTLDTLNENDSGEGASGEAASEAPLPLIPGAALSVGASPLSSPLIDDHHSDLPSVHTITRPSRTNPFFSSGGGRDRGAMIHQGQGDRGANGGNTGRVITTLQSDLLYARTALDQSKSQLRLSQRTVESLTRQTEDLKESMARLRLENEGLSKMLSRKERTVTELMDRCKRSEGELGSLKQDKKELEIGLKKMSKESDEVVKDSVRRRERAEREYEAVRSGVKSMSEGWKRDVSSLRQDMSKLEEKHRKEMEDSRMKYNTLAKLHASRSGALSTLESSLNSLQTSKESFIEKYNSELGRLKAGLEKDERTNLESLELAKEVSGECARFKRILRNHGQQQEGQSVSSSVLSAPGKSKR